MVNSIPRRNPNNINRSRLDAKVALGVCPLSKPTLQLVPLRYGLVDNPALDPATALSMPYRLSSRPLGIRLPRDGWLYVIDSATGELSEYRLLDGLLTQLLLKSTAVTEDERQTSIGPPHLIVSRHSTLHVTYAETQWTARKCQQVLNSAEERTHFMQAVHPGLTNCQTGGTHLLTPQRVRPGSMPRTRISRSSPASCALVLLQFGLNLGRHVVIRIYVLYVVGILERIDELHDLARGVGVDVNREVRHELRLR